MREDHPLLAGCPRCFWNDLANIHAAQACVEASVEELIAALSAPIDPESEIPSSFWQLCLAPFLWSLLSYVFDRAATTDASSRVSEVGLVPTAGFSARECVRLLHEDPAVQAWVDEVTDALLLGMDVEAIAARLKSQVIERPSISRKTPQMTHGWAGRLRRSVMFWEGHGEIVHFGAPFTHAEARRMARLSKGRIRRLPFPEQSARVCWRGDQRGELVRQCGSRLSQPLARIALPVVCSLAPTACIEQLREVWDWVAGHPTPKLAATVLGAERSPYFAALVARMQERGGKLVGMQHGGYYGATDWTWYEKLEYQVSDVYATWGYRQREKHQPMPAVRLSQLERCGPSGNPPGPGKQLRLFWAHDTNVGGAASLAAVPQFRRLGEYQKSLARGLGNVATQLGAQVVLRPYPRLPNESALDVWREHVEGLRIEPGAGRSLIAQAQEHHVSLFGFPGATGFIEHIHAGWPAIIFCPPDFCPVRPEARAVFGQLIEAGLYAETEQQLETVLRQIQQEGLNWWAAPQRTAARETFRLTFCLTSDDPCSDWAEALQGWCDSTGFTDQASA